MRVLKKILGFLFSRFLWTLIGIVVLCALIWFYGPLISVGDVQPLEADLTRLIVISVIVILWLVSMLLRQMRAAAANRVDAVKLLIAKGADKRKAWEDVLWAVINTREFLFRH